MGNQENPEILKMFLMALIWKGDSFYHFGLRVLCRGQGNCGSLSSLVGDHSDHRVGGSLAAIKNCCAETTACSPDQRLPRC